MTRYLALGAFVFVSLRLVLAQEQSEPSATPSKFSTGSGTFFVEADGAEADLVSTKDPAQRIKIPVPGEDESLNPDDEFHLSSDDEWIFAGRHGSSCLRSGDLYHRSGQASIARIEDFNTTVWVQAAKLRVMKRNWSADGLCAMTFFAGWSSDSGRLLIGLLGGEDRRDNHFGYLYFNSRTKRFETSDYLRRLNANKAAALPCVEPVQSLAKSDELKARA